MSSFLQFILILNSFIVPKLVLDAFGSDVNGLISSVVKTLVRCAAVFPILTSGLTVHLWEMNSTSSSDEGLPSTTK